MTLSRAKPATFKPRGVSDAIDGTNAADGAMAVLTNLVPAPSTASVFVPRAAAAKAIDFSTFDAGATFVSVQFPVGNLIYGMITSGTYSGKDRPFCYDTAAAAFIAISGVSAPVLPASVSSSGDWTPPRMAMISTKIIVCHPGFGGGAESFGVIDVTNPAAPTWAATNTTVNALVAVPKDVFNFNGRAYYAVGNKAVYSDALAPTVVTNASQALTLGDGTAVTAFGGIPILATSTGTVVQNLLAFKGVEAIFTISGDQATSNLSVTTLNVPTGTLAPNSIASTPLGLAFIAPDGLRMVGLTGTISDPVGAHGDGVCVPFQSALYPSRMCAAFNQNTLRVSVQNGASATQDFQEYWLDFTLKAWSGPHTCPHSTISAYTPPAGSNFAGDGFLGGLVGVNGSLWSSTTIPRQNSSYTENGIDLSWTWRTCLLPDNQVMLENDLNETAAGLVMPAQQAVTVICADESGAILGTIYLTGPNLSASVWGAFVWGGSVWGAQSGWFRQYALNWSEPLVFKQMTVQFSGASQGGFAIGNLYMRYQVLNYLLQN